MTGLKEAEFRCNDYYHLLRKMVFGLVMFCGFLCIGLDVSVALEVQRMQGAGRAREMAGENGDGENEDQPEGEGGYNHARLPMDPDVQLFIQRAQDFIRSEQYDLAIQVLQRALDEGRDVMVRTAPRTYKTVSRSAQDMLSELPGHAFESYQILADAQAEALLEGPNARRKPEVLRKVVHRFFLSSYGAEAAYWLACLQINQGKFSAAVRLLRLIQEYHSNYPVPAEKFLFQLAVAQAYAGDSQGARETFKTLKAEYEGLRLPVQLDQLEKKLVGKTELAESSHPSQNWPMALGGPDRLGIAPDPRVPRPSEGQRPMVSVWEKSLRKDPSKSNKGTTAQDDFLKQMWNQKKSRPANHLVETDKQVWISSPYGVQCVDKKTGRRLWFNPGKAPIGEATQDKDRRRGRYRRRLNMPLFAFFKDRVGGRMSHVKGLLVRVEGNWRTVWKRRRVKRGKRRVYVTDQPGSYLTAYEPETGKIRWSVGGGQAEGKEVLAGARFLTAPIVSGSKLLVVVEQDDGLYLTALKPRDGDVIWQKFLCSYATSAIPPTNPVGLSMRGGEVYVATGKGVVFAADGVSGDIYWARTYSSQEMQWQPRRERQQRTKSVQPDGWEENVVFPVQGSLVVLPSDASKLFCFDRSTGELKYQKAREKAEYPLGVQKGRLIVGGDTFVRAYEVTDGEIVWEKKVGLQAGRGILTSEYVLVPQETSIQVLDPRSGDRRYSIRGIKRSVGEWMSLGNLYSTGDHLLSVGLRQASAFGPGDKLLVNLNKRVKTQKTSGAYMARGKFFSKTGRYAKAVEDFQKAREISLEDPLRTKFRELTKELESTQERLLDVRKKLAWFGDDFNRKTLGPDYTAVEGSFKLEDGHIKMSGGKNMVLRLDKKIPGNFVAEIEGWQHQKPCDLSFQFSIDGENRSVKQLYAQFGSTWNKWNYISFSGNRVVKSSDYLIEKGKKHHLRVEKVGRKLTLYADGQKLVEHSGGRIPAGEKTKTTLHLYGFGKPHYFDNLIIRLLDEDGNLKEISGDANKSLSTAEKKMKKKLEKLKAKTRDIKRSMDKLRGKGYVSLSSIRTELFKNILELLKSGTKQRAKLVQQAQDLAQTPRQKMQLKMADMQVAAAMGDVKVAAEKSFQLLRNETTKMFQWDPKTPLLKTDLALWVEEKLAGLHEKMDESGKKQMRNAAEKAYTQIQQKKDVKSADLYRFMRDCPDPMVAVKAGRAAAKRAQKAGKVALTELILLQLKRRPEPVAKASAQADLIQFYRQQGWNRQAKFAMKSLQEKHGDVQIDVAGQPQTAQQYSRTALKELREQVDSPDELRPEVLPDPPYELLWKKDKRWYPVNRHLPGKVPNQFLEDHVIVRDRRRRHLACIRVRDGKVVWKQIKGRRDRLSRFVRRGNVVFGGRQNAEAFSLVTGERLWRRDVGNSRNRVQYRENTDAGRNYVFSNQKSETETTVRALDKVTGRERWRRQVWNSSRPRFYVESDFLFSRQRGAGGKGEYQVYNALKGTPVDLDIQLAYGGMHSIMGDEVVAVKDEKYVLQSLRDGHVIWEIPVEKQKNKVRRIRIVDVENTHLFFLQTEKKLILVDPQKKQVRWRLNTGNDRHYYRFAYNRRLDEIFSLFRQRHDGQWVRIPWIINAKTGEVVSKIRTDKYKNLYVRRQSPMNKDYILTRWYEVKKKKNRTSRRQKYWVLVRREDSKVVPDVKLPHTKDVGKKSKRSGFRATVVGDVILMRGQGKLLAYGRRKKEE